MARRLILESKDVQRANADIDWILIMAGYCCLQQVLCGEFTRKYPIKFDEKGNVIETINIDRNLISAYSTEAPDSS